MQPGFFTQQFLKSLPSDNLEALVALADEFNRSIIELEGEDAEGFDQKHYNHYVESFAIFRAFCKARGLKIQLPKLASDWEENMGAIYGFIRDNSDTWEKEINKRSTNSLLSEKEDEYENIFSSGQTYEFTDNDIQRVQELINELRELISTSNLITDDHKRRLLRRLEAMQGEIHKHTSDIDRFWGFVAEAGIVARKFGEDLKPISDRVTEIGKIVIGVVMSKEGIKALPDITKLLNP